VPGMRYVIGVVVGVVATFAAVLAFWEELDDIFGGDVA
jgi:hypothetical protein